MEQGRKMLIAVTAVCSSIAAFVLSFSCIRIYCNRKKSGKLIKHKQEDPENGLAMSPLLSRYDSLRSLSVKGLISFIDYKMLERGTKKFSHINILGQGGFGHVYKATLDNGTQAAVKKLNCSTMKAAREFENEVDLLSRFKHPNVISFLGYIIEDEAGFVVYELMHNGSLDTQLHGPTRGSALTWLRRLKIALDVAKGLEYLHERCFPHVIHRDLKSSNILLDSNFNAKLSDFGLAVSKKKPSDEDLKLAGTVGYMAPEYVALGELSRMSDVYSYGVVITELLLGRKPVEIVGTTGRESLVKWAKDVLTNKIVFPNIVDPVIRGTMDAEHLHQVASMAYLCLQEKPNYRPKPKDILQSLMSLVPEELGGNI